MEWSTEDSLRRTVVKCDLEQARWPSSKGFATKPNHLHLIPRTHMVKEENSLPPVVSSDLPNAHHGVCISSCIHTQNSKYANK